MMSTLFCVISNFTTSTNSNRRTHLKKSFCAVYLSIYVSLKWAGKARHLHCLTNSTTGCYCICSIKARRKKILQTDIVQCCMCLALKGVRAPLRKGPIARELNIFVSFSYAVVLMHMLEYFSL